MSNDGGRMFSAATGGRMPPLVTPDTEFFWEGTRSHKLLVQRCSACGATRHPPGPACPHCHSLEYEPVEQQLEGSLHSFMVQHRPLPPGFEGPCIVGLIEFDDGTRLVSNIVDVDPDDLEIGEHLQVFFVDQDEGWTAPQFRRPGTS